MTKYTVRAASSPIIINGWSTVGSFFNTGLCPRISYLRSIGIEKPVEESSKKYFTIGMQNETNWIEKLTTEGISFNYQYDIEEKLSDNVTFSGHPDIVLKTGEVLELKSVSSPNSYKSKFVKEPLSCEWEHLTQIAKYMLALEADKGRIIYTSFAEGHEGEEKQIPVRRKGDLFLAGGHEISARAIQEGKEVAAEQLETSKLFPDFPIIQGGSKQDVCARCPMNTTCYSSLKRIKGEDFQEAARKLGWGARES